MKTIISDNAEVECQNMITAFLDVEFIKSKIVQAYPNLSATKQKTVSEDIRFYISQRFFHDICSCRNQIINFFF